MPLPKTTVERVTGRTPAKPAGEKPAERNPSPKAPGKRPKRREEVIEEDEEHSSKVATVAVILCSVVAVAAIIVFIVAMMNGGLRSQSELIRVPDLLGKTQEELASVTDVNIRVGDRQYSDQYAKGQIMFQNPKEGTQIAKGSYVTVHISLGPKPAAKTMENLVGQDETNAVNFLTSVLGIDPNKITVNTETHPTIAAGLVIRTDPAEGEELKEDQTVTIWISAGAEARMEKVPNVTGQTMEKALALLKANGFENVVCEPVESNKDKNIVVDQSILAQTEVDVTTQIVLKVSAGDGSTPEPTDPTLPTEDPELVTKIVTVALSEDMVETYTLSIWLDGTLLEEREIPVGTISTQFALTGKGIMEFELRINDANPWKIEVDFDAE